MKYEQIDSNLYRGEHPLDLADLKILKSLNVRMILNLERGWFEFLHHRMNWEVVNGTFQGLRVYHLPLSDFQAPTKDEVTAALAMIDSMESGGVYVHCMHGVDRTGVIVAAHRVFKQNWTPQAAVNEMYKKGFHRWAYWWWVPKLLSILETFQTLRKS